MGPTRRTPTAPPGEPPAGSGLPDDGPGLPADAAPRLEGLAALIDQGRAANSAGRPSEGERVLRGVLRTLSRADPGATTDFPSVAGGAASVAEARVRALLSLSTSLVERSGPTTALRTARQALGRADDPAQPGRTALVAMCHSQLAMLYGRSGRNRTALAELDLALVGMDGLAPQERFRLLLNRGALRLEEPDAGRAAEDFEAAARLAADQGMVRQEFMARHNLGYAAALAGDLPTALSTMLAADRLPADVSRAVPWHGRAQVLLDAGLVQEGVDLLRQATQLAAEGDQQLEAGHAMVDLAQGLLLLGDLDGAVATARDAARALRRQAPGLRRRADLVRLGARLRARTGLAEVARRGAALAAEFDADGDGVAADLARLVAAEAHTRRGRHTEALDLLDRSADLTRVGSISTRMRTRAVLASAARAGGELPGARRHVRAALRDLARALHASSSLELRAATLVQGRQLAQIDLELAGAGAGRRLAAAERWREVASHLPNVRPPADPDVARSLAALRQVEQQIQEDPGRAGRLRERRRRLERQLAGASWSMPATGTEPAPTPSLATARERLAERDTTAVYYVEDGTRLGAVVLRRRRSRWVDLGPQDVVVEATRRLAADVAASARVAGGPMARVVQQALASSSRAADELLLRPLAVEGRVVVVPVAALAGVPWGLLPSRAGQPTTVAPSLGTWARGTRTVQAPGVVPLAGPGLPGALTECAAVSSVWGTPAPASFAAAADLSRAVADADLVHVAAHGSHRADSPLFSSVWLEDGPTFLTDLERLPRTASHVVVSACDTGRSAAGAAGDAALGLASGLLSLGVSCVVASACPVPDATASDLMPRYHRWLAQGREVDEALAAAVAECDQPLAGVLTAWGSPWSVARA